MDCFYTFLEIQKPVVLKSLVLILLIENTRGFCSYVLSASRISCIVTVSSFSILVLDSNFSIDDDTAPYSVQIQHKMLVLTVLLYH